MSASVLPARPEAGFLQLARLAGDGDAFALGVLARHVQPLLEAHARRALARLQGAGLDVDDLAEEAVAEVQAFLSGDGGEGPGWRRFEEERGAGALDGWLYGVVRNKIRRRLRDARRRQELLARSLREAPLPAGWDPTSAERSIDAARALRLAGALPPRERAALHLWLEDAPSREIATRLRFASPHAVDCCLARGKQRLRRMMLEGEAQAAA